MMTRSKKLLGRMVAGCLAAAGVFISAGLQAATVTVDVVDGAGNPVEGFRWLLQRDETFPVDPANPPTTADEALSLSFHRSYHPVATSNGVALSGNTDVASETILDVDPGRYYLSVLPYADHSLGGIPVDVRAGDAAVEVAVQAHPIPTARISVYLFLDNNPLNNAPDFPQEEASNNAVDWTQFSIVLEEPAGRYGIAGGPVLLDAFGNPLGTVYDKTCDEDGNPDLDPLTNFACLDADGAPIVTVMGDGTLQPDADGFLVIENLAPGKYGIVVIPPVADPPWQQTSTIEGSPVVDAWVQANEPRYFVEFGPPTPHMFYGFIQEFSDLPGGATISGQILDTHLSRPPATALYPGRPFPGCWVGLNVLEGAAVGETLFAAPCDGDSNYEIAGVPAGTYQIVVFDTNLDIIVHFQTVIVDAGETTCNGGLSCAGNDIAVNSWFNRLYTWIFNDLDEDGVWDAGEGPVGPEAGPVNLRWRDGTVFQSFPTDGEGAAPFEEIFPFFHWLVAEVGFVNKKATGATFVVDAGGEPDPAYDSLLTPYTAATDPVLAALPDCDLDPAAEICTADGESITQRGVVLTQAYQGFAGQTNFAYFGKKEYVNFEFNPPAPYVGPQYVGENGGVSGMVLYATTRAEDDPRYAAGEEWEPGVPRVQVNLYADGDIDCFPTGNFETDPDACDIDWNGDGVRDPNDGVIDDVNQSGGIDLADVDNYPFGWSEGGARGPEDVDHDNDTVFDPGDAIQITWTDSWDDSLPSECQGTNNTPLSTISPPIADDRCFDGLRNWNQLRPGVFDGGYAFDAYGDWLPTPIQAQLSAFYGELEALGAAFDPPKQYQLGMIPGEYVVEATAPPGYKTLREHHKNVDFGDEYVPAPEALPPICVGPEQVVPEYLAMVTKDGSGDAAQLIPGIEAIPAPYAGELRPVCDQKYLQLSGAQNAAADFWVMTDVPVVGNGSGLMNNDLINTFDPSSPMFGEKFTPPLLPIGFYDWNGAQVNRVYSDIWGRYNVVVPSTFTANLPQPSGMSPNMVRSCMNDPGPIPNPDFLTDPDAPEFIIDPAYNPQFTQTCYTLQYMPGAITYLDTPVLPNGAFIVSLPFGSNPVDCERPTDTPLISSVQRRNGSGDPGPYALPGDEVRIRSLGRVDVPNPEWDGLDPATETVERDYRFGQYRPEEESAVLLTSNQDGTVYEIQTEADGIRAWRQRRIDFFVPDIPVGTYQVAVRTRDGVISPNGMTLTVGVDVAGLGERVPLATFDAGNPEATTGAILRVDDDGAQDASATYTSIQDAIDAAAPGDLVLVAPGTYEEMVIMWKPVKLQGWGAGRVFITARQVPVGVSQEWRDKAQALVDAGEIDFLPGQGPTGGGFTPLTGGVFTTEAGAGVFVVGANPAENPDAAYSAAANQGARVDGFTVLASATAGGIILNGYTGYSTVGNNRVIGNAGAWGGGIRVGHPDLVDGAVYTDAQNDNVRIHHNHVAQNSGMGGVGGGIGLHTGSDGYWVQKNWVCGNYTTGDGAGIGHLGVSHGGLIEDNEVIFNESFGQEISQTGGGILIAGQPALVAGVGPGSGSVTVDANLIRGNYAGAGDGGGVSLLRINGEDVANNPADPTQWYTIGLYNNMINNNAAALAGAGVALSDALLVSLRNNTVARNDTFATVAAAFVPGSLNETVPQPAGVVSRLHSADLALLVAGNANLDIDSQRFSDPTMTHNILWENRAFYWFNDDPTTPLVNEGAVLNPSNCADPTAGCDLELADVPGYTWDLEVLAGSTPTGDLLNPRRSVLTLPYAGGNNNVVGLDPAFENPYYNGSRNAASVGYDYSVPTYIDTAGAFDEGGNFIQVIFGPLSLVEMDATANNPEGDVHDYHITATSSALDIGGTLDEPEVQVDFDNQARPAGLAWDAGADELSTEVPALNADTVGPPVIVF